MLLKKSTDEIIRRKPRVSLQKPSLANLLCTNNNPANAPGMRDETKGSAREAGGVEDGARKHSTMACR
jgi:hypothetical protein